MIDRFGIGSEIAKILQFRFEIWPHHISRNSAAFQLLPTWDWLRDVHPTEVKQSALFQARLQFFHCFLRL